MSLGLAPQLPASAGPLAELERRLLGLIEQVRIENGVGYQVRRGTRGTVLEVSAGVAGAAGIAPAWGDVLDVRQNELTVVLDSGSEVVVMKPPELQVELIAEYNSAVLTDFRDGLGLPTSPTWWHWFTEDYLMRTTGFPDEVTIDGWTGGVQSRFRLVHAPHRDASSFTPPRFEMLEVVWPPYFVATGGQGGVVRGSGSRILAGRVGDTYHDLNVDARRWKPEPEVSGWQTVQTDGAGNGVTSNVSYQRT